MQTVEEYVRPLIVAEEGFPRRPRRSSTRVTPRDFSVPGPTPRGISGSRIWRRNRWRRLESDLGGGRAIPAGKDGKTLFNELQYVYTANRKKVEMMEQGIRLGSASGAWITQSCTRLRLLPRRAEAKAIQAYKKVQATMARSPSRACGSPSVAFVVKEEEGRRCANGTAGGRIGFASPATARGWQISTANPKKGRGHVSLYRHARAFVLQGSRWRRAHQRRRDHAAARCSGNAADG